VSGSPYAITASGAADTDYSITYVSGALTVTPAALTITANNQTKVYGAALPTLSASYSGFVNGDTAASLTTQPTLGTTATSASHVSGSPYAITASGAADTDYSITYVSGTLTVIPAALTITANNQIKVYGAALPTLTASYTGFVNGDTAATLGISPNVAPSLATSATTASDVVASGYAITISGAVDPDYSITYVNGTLTIAPASQTIIWSNPAAIIAGTALNSTQLNATVSVVGPAPAGALTYTPPAGTVLGAGSGQVLSVTAAATQDYNTATASVTINVLFYGFSGFLPPLSKDMAFALGRTIPIKFQLFDASGAPITSLGAVSSLQIQGLDSKGNPLGAPFNPTPAGNTVLRNDGSQFIFNWQTKGLTAGGYEILLTLADDTVETKVLQLSANGSSAGLTTVAAGGTGSAPGGLLGGDITLYVDNTNGDLSADELARIQDAVTAADAVTEPYGVAVTEVTDPTAADVTLKMDTTSAVGGFADGVLGCTTDAGQITLINGWNFYAGSDGTQIGSGQFDFGTVVTHELGHALGVGHSADNTSVMYATLNAGTVNRSLTASDLNVPDTDTTGACGLHVAVVHTPISALGTGSIPTDKVFGFQGIDRVKGEMVVALLCADATRSTITFNNDYMCTTRSASRRAGRSLLAEKLESATSSPPKRPNEGSRATLHVLPYSPSLVRARKARSMDPPPNQSQRFASFSGRNSPAEETTLCDRNAFHGLGMIGDSDLGDENLGGCPLRAVGATWAVISGTARSWLWQVCRNRRFSTPSLCLKAPQPDGPGGCTRSGRLHGPTC
jgi:hypothetical protein